MPKGRKKTSLAVAYCSNGSVDHAFCESLAGLILYDAHDRALIDTVLTERGPIIAHDRNALALRFLSECKSEWLLFLDADMRFTVHDAYKLVDVADPITRPIVGALYVGVNESGDTSLLWYEEGPEGEAEVTPSSLRFGELQEITGCGMGFTLVHRNVLARMMNEHKEPDPWVFFDYGMFLDPVSGVHQRWGEDFTFCRRARELGFSVWGAPDVQVGHVKRIDIRY